MSEDAPTGPPWDEQAELSVLGAVLLEPRAALQEVASKLAPEHFYKEGHRHIYRAMIHLDEIGQPIDTVTLVDRLRAMGELQSSGGGAYLARITNATPSAANVARYAAIVRARALQRAVLSFGRRTASTAMAEVEDVDVFVDDVAREANELANEGVQSRVARLDSVLATNLTQVEKRYNAPSRGGITGCPTGFHALDKKTAGWQPSDLIILAARPGMGKTAFALNMLVNAARDQRFPTAGVIFSLEMSKEQLANRLWCAHTRVPMEYVRTGDLDERKWQSLYDGFAQLKELNIFIDDTPQISVAEMMRKCRQLKHEENIGLVMVDYLQLMGTGSSSKASSREQQISEISRSLKGLAKELHVPVIALSQLNRGVEQRPNKRPMLSDLRESGAIEQDADIITFLYRESYYIAMGNKKDGAGPGGPGGPGGPVDDEPDVSFDPTAPSVTEVILAKHRSGSTGKVELLFHPPYTLFTNIEPDNQPPTPGDADRPPRMSEGAPFPSPGGGDGGPPPTFDGPPPDFGGPPPDFGGPGSDPGPAQDFVPFDMPDGDDESPF